MPVQAWHLLILLMAHPHMPFYYTTATAQSNAMSLISLAPPTSIAVPTTEASAAATTAAVSTESPSSSTTTISYPSGTPTINYEDTVLVSYDTPWGSAELTVYCQDGSSFLSYDANNIPSSGTYNLSPVEGSLDVSKYPSLCHITLSDSDDSANTINGGDFTLVSTVGAVKTYAASTTITALSSVGPTTTGSKTSTASTITSLASLQTTSSRTTSNSSRSLSSTSTDIAGAASTSTSTPSSSSSSHSGLSGGAKAGIAIAVILILALLLLGALVYRRQRQKHHQQLQAVQSELASERAKYASEKAYLDSILKVAGKPDTEHGGKIHVEDDVRQSGDWRRFFGSKAASAAAAVGAVIANSRPGSRRASMARSRLGTPQEEEDLPAVPTIPDFPMPPSPSIAGSMTGGASPSDMGEARSTTGLIAPGRRK